MTCAPVSAGLDATRRRYCVPIVSITPSLRTPILIVAVRLPSITPTLGAAAAAAALAVAKTNAQQHGITNVSFLQGDWYDALPTETHVDVIVSNPPYVAEKDPHLEQGDVRFEPRHALASGNDGLDDIRKLLPGAIVHLGDGGSILVEHGNTQGAAVRDLMRHFGYREIRTLRDLEGHERVTLGIYRAMPI